MAAVTKNKKRGDENFKIFISETAEPIGTKLCLNSPWVIPFQIVSDSPDLQPTWPPLLKIEKGGGGEIYLGPSIAKIIL